MRKILCAILASVMTASICVPCFAQETPHVFKLKDGEQLIVLKADNFKSDLGRWKIKGAESNSVLSVLEGVTISQDEPLLPANTTITIDKAGTYYVHALGLDYAENQPATRHFGIALDDELLDGRGGTHKEQGWRWQLLGQKVLETGELKVSLVDTSNFFGRCQAIALTTDKDFVPPSDDELLDISNKYGVGDEFKVKEIIPVNKLGKAVMLFLGSPKTYVMGKETKVDVNNDTVVPFTENDRTLVPVRFIAESFGAKVGWDDATQTVTVEVNEKVIKMILGQAEMDVDGNKVILDTPANTYNDRTFIPLRAMVEAINKKVFWDDRGLIIISDLTFDAETDKELIEKAIDGFNGETVNFSPVKEDLSEYVNNVGDVDYMLDYFNPAEFKERNGLVNTINKLKNGEKVTVAFMGGSISEQDGWRGKALEWLKAQYPEAEIEELNLTIGGTGADLAVCRAESELIPYKPDLVFFEYAVNGGTSQNAEGLVRKLWKDNPTADICFVHTLRTDYVRNYKNNIPSEYEYAYEIVADYYGIPSVSFGYQIADFYEQGKLTLSASAPEEGKILFTKDTTHPTMEGSILYAGAVARAIATMDKHTVKSEFVHEVKEALFKDNWENAKALSYTEAQFDGNWQEFSFDGTSYGEDFPYQSGFSEFYVSLFPNFKGTKTPGSSFTVKFTGTSLGLFHFGGPFSCFLNVSVDGKEPYRISTHTGYNDHMRYQYVFIPDVPYGEHTVTFTLDSAVPDKTGLSDYNERIEEYTRTHFYLGRILVQE